MHHLLILFMHHLELLFLYFCANLQSALDFFFFLCFFLVLFCISCPFLSTMSRKTRANRKVSFSFVPSFESERFLSEKHQETYEKLNLKRNIWAERKVLLDELDLEIRHNFER